MIIALAFIIFIIIVFVAEFPSKTKRQTKGVQVDGRNFEYRFWDEDFGDFTVHYAGVYEILPPTKFLCFEIPNEITVRAGWGMDDRIDWCDEQVVRYLQEEKDEMTDIDKVKAFCESEG